MRRYLQMGAAALLCLLLVSAVGMAQGTTTLRIGRAADVRELNPFNQAGNDTSEVTYQIHEGLVTMNPAQEITPMLATSWELLDDGLTYRFHLRQGVVFHSGHPFTAEDVKWNLEMQLSDTDPGVAKGLVPDYASIRIIDDYTIDVTLKKPNGVYVNILCAPVFVLVDPTRYAELGENYGSNPSGTGAFKYVSWEPNQRVILEKNENYWGEVGALVDRVIFEVIPDANARVIALQNGEIDIAWAVPAEDMPRLEADARLQVYRIPRMRIEYIGINHAHPFLTRNVRSALAFAMDKAQIMSVVGDNGVLATGAGVPSAFGFKDADWPFDLATAQKCIEADGWMLGSDGYRYKDGQKLLLTVLTRGLTPGELEALQVIQLQWKVLGVQLEIQVVDSAAWRSTLDNGARAHHEQGIIPPYMLYTGATGIRTGEVGYIIETPKSDQGHRNWERYNNPVYDYGFDISQAPGTDEERLYGYHIMADLFRYDVIWLPVFVLQGNYAASVRVEGFVPNPNDSLNLKGVSLK